MKELQAQLGGDARSFRFEGASDAQALFTYHLHAMPNEVSSRISTSTALAAWNGSGEPDGWFRNPTDGRRRPDGDPAREYVRR